MASYPDFVAIATPKPNEALHNNSDVDETAPTTWKNKVALAAHWAVGAIMVYAFFALTVMYTSMTGPITTSFFNPLWGIDPNVKGSGHAEMMSYTYHFFAIILPVFAAFLLVRLVTKGATFPIPLFSHMLQRKPRIFRSLVSYGEAFFLLLVTGGNIIFFAYTYMLRVKPTSTTQDKIGIAGTALGYSALYNMVFLALPASRHCFWMEWLGIPFPHGVKYHRWLGIATMLCTALHTVLFIQVYAAKHRLQSLVPCFDCNLATTGMRNWMATFAWLSFFCMLVMAVTSTPYVRRHYYKTFYASHFLFIPMTAFAVMHWGGMIIWLFTSIVLYIGNRMMSSATVSAPVIVQHAIAYRHRVTEFVFACATSYAAGDIVYLKVPSISSTQWHPFSVASSPLHTPGSLAVYIKARGDWTNQLHAYVHQCSVAGVAPVVFMDGGYVPAAPVPSSFDKVVFVAGGIGATPLLGRALHVLHAYAWQDVHFIWHVRDVNLLVQFQQWFHDASSLSSRLHLHLYVTTASLSDAFTDTERVFNLKTCTVPPRPFANVSTLRQVLLFVGAFVGAGTLLVAVHYGNKISTIHPAYWPLQRFMEFAAIIVGAYWAYFVVLIKPYSPVPSAGSVVDDIPKEPTMTTEAFIERYHVQRGRMDWSIFFAGLGDSKTASWTTPTIGVYVSGPKTLSRAIDAQAHSTRFAVHHEEFEM
ncbi:hypothetical protein SDRG_08449 [Saprolegnia diclina VS20]|uniref:FAD-binding FR-type domain-containing protein n=1 Tax=Saprolegnia diclina (strain VS20) TaxID=1156394 RepID=T0RV34_SAPDV|nr:hypothetical protein SDRG_08449 [Saprolegnia diclina VS20]EQC34247.1 hypothetical protein SDRG_08449 [Saprolegnia diclina VS20]|eukprot:XP_008612559.1 hypothetical protein SDRG_08449 [Saprolegnia diclina VS20]